MLNYLLVVVATIVVVIVLTLIYEGYKILTMPPPSADLVAISVTKDSQGNIIGMRDSQGNIMPIMQPTAK